MSDIGVWICPIIGCGEENICSDGDVGGVCRACGVYVSFEADIDEYLQFEIERDVE